MYAISSDSQAFSSARGRRRPATSPLESEIPAKKARYETSFITAALGEPASSMSLTGMIDHLRVVDRFEPNEPVFEDIETIPEPAPGAKSAETWMQSVAIQPFERAEFYGEQSVVQHAVWHPVQRTVYSEYTPHTQYTSSEMATRPVLPSYAQAMTNRVPGQALFMPTVPAQHPDVFPNKSALPESSMSGRVVLLEQYTAKTWSQSTSNSNSWSLSISGSHSNTQPPSTTWMTDPAVVSAQTVPIGNPDDAMEPCAVCHPVNCAPNHCCRPCKNFLKRAILGQRDYRCKRSNACDLRGQDRRNRCNGCRIRKLREAGLTIEGEWMSFVDRFELMT